MSLINSVESVGLEVLGAAEGGYLVLLGPREPGFWPMFQASQEMADGQPNPLDRWSRRVIDTLAKQLNAEAVFPFGGPPHQPFLAWALETGRFWQSPVGMLVHDRQGLMVSLRGAIRLDNPIALDASISPCLGCSAPCKTACPADALSKDNYAVDACHDFLDQGGDCRQLGCKARRICPISQSYGRLEEQSAFHMKAFHP